MSNKLKKKSRNVQTDTSKDSVFKEAWDNMNQDMARVMPDFITRRFVKKKGKMWIMVVVTLIELLILGVAGKLLYDWLTT
jgi:hypothetical protein